MKNRLYIVIPCYNEEDVLPKTVVMFLNKLEELKEKGLCEENSKILFVNDGSKDKTWDLIQKYSKENASIEGISLSRNRGHQNALLAGLMYAKERADVTISIDCDGQDDINAMDSFLKEYSEGVDIVYGVRSKRETDTFFKRFTAEGFYKFMNLMGADIVFNHADYRLMSKRALDGLAEFKEVNLFLRGIVPLIGYKSSSVYYERNERLAGESHYPLGKMINLALNGITSLSVEPLRYITIIGILMSVVSFCILGYSLITRMFGFVVTGWTSIVSVMTLIGGIQLFCLGIIGEYIGKIYSETKQRPKFIIAETTEKE